MFTEKFGSFVTEGDSIACTIGRFAAKATVYRDDDNTPPNERVDGFWPSRDKKAAGYVLPENYAAEQSIAERALKTWQNDEWFYCGVSVTVECEGIRLTGQFDSALWGIECNYPDSDNSYLQEVANDLLGEAMDKAKVKLAALCNGKES